MSLAGHLQRANIHGVELHVLLTLVEHRLLRQVRADLHLGFPRALHVQLDDLRGSSVVGGPAQDLSKFQMAPIPILSVLTCSTS